MTYKWWEKTVEYRFVLTAAEHGQMFAVPLDGEEEKAGDTIFSLASKWLLIEFKRDAACLRTERAKFSDYEKASAALAPRDGHHFLVYGSPGERGSRLPFELSYVTFFSRRPRAAFAEVMASGTDSLSFARYIHELVMLKKSTKAGEGGKGGALEIDSFRHLLVAGVNSDNQLVTCVSLGEFVLSLSKAREQVQKQNHQAPPPTRTRGPER